MEGVGSRLGRTSSRYGPVASAPVFSGPVRKWKRQWVLSRPNNNNSNGRSSGGGGGNGGNNQHGGGGPTPNSLFLFRWTPLPSDDDGSVNPPKRKLRFTPVVALEEKKRKADVEDKTSEMNQSAVSETPSSDDVFDKMNVDDDFVKKNQEPSVDQFPSPGKHLDLDLFVKGYDDNSHISSRTEETQGMRGQA